ncbi:MAG: penicillin-binding protein activator [Pseudomonadota bacterium]
MRRILVPLLALVALGACVAQAPNRPGFAPGFGAAETPRTRVALLLPLSGSQASLGRAMQNAAELALFEAGNPDVDFIPTNTMSTAGGAAEAARSAINSGARIIVGPLTAAETSAVSVPARSARVPVLAFTNDEAQGGPGVWPLGITPAQQVRRVVAIVAGAGIRRVALGAPDDAFGRALARALRDAAAEFSLPPPVIALHPPRAEPGAAARELATAAGPDGIEAVLLGHAGAAARVYAAGLVAGGLTVPPLRILGHGLWQGDAGLSNEPALHGAVFAAPDPRARARFEQRYLAAYGDRPPRVASVAYDAARIAAQSLARGGSPVGAGDIVNGADGPLRLLPDGTALRGLALYRVEGSGEATAIEAARLPGSAGS